jgi:hypothetical protein
LTNERQWGLASLRLPECVQHRNNSGPKEEIFVVVIETKFMSRSTAFTSNSDVPWAAAPRIRSHQANPFSLDVHGLGLFVYPLHSPLSLSTVAGIARSLFVKFYDLTNELSLEEQPTDPGPPIFV